LKNEFAFNMMATNLLSRGNNLRPAGQVRPSKQNNPACSPFTNCSNCSTREVLNRSSWAAVQSRVKSTFHADGVSLLDFYKKYIKRKQYPNLIKSYWRDGINIWQHVCVWTNLLVNETQQEQVENTTFWWPLARFHAFHFFQLTTWNTETFRCKAISNITL